MSDNYNWGELGDSRIPGLATVLIIALFVLDYLKLYYKKHHTSTCLGSHQPNLWGCHKQQAASA